MLRFRMRRETAHGDRVTLAKANGSAQKRQPFIGPTFPPSESPVGELKQRGRAESETISNP